MEILKKFHYQNFVLAQIILQVFLDDGELGLSQNLEIQPILEEDPRDFSIVAVEEDINCHYITCSTGLITACVLAVVRVYICFGLLDQKTNDFSSRSEPQRMTHYWKVVAIELLNVEAWRPNDALYHLSQHVVASYLSILEY